MTSTDSLFAGSIPAQYDRYLGPLLFEPYAEEITKRAQALGAAHVLETAAGTGIVTAALQRALPDAQIAATDLNPAMLGVAPDHVRSDKVRFQPADAQQLPFDDGSFDLVVCQFGVMFYPDKVKGNSEARRVLRHGGKYIVVIWDSLERNPVSRAMHEALVEEFPEDPPRFIERAPFGYADSARIEQDLRAAGFSDIRIETVSLSSRVNANEAALGMCCGSPLNVEIMERGSDAVDRAVTAAEHALQRFDGSEAPMSAHIVTATR